MLTTTEKPITTDMKQRQAPLRERYTQAPAAAVVTDHARSSRETVPTADPLRGEIVFSDPANTRLPVALHAGVGGTSAGPVPGDILCAAIASCLDSTIRVIANMLGVSLAELEVAVEADVDLRGTLKMNPEVPVGFSDIRLAVRMEPVGPVPAPTMDAILAAAEQSCVVMQTLRRCPQIEVTRVR